VKYIYSIDVTIRNTEESIKSIKEILNNNINYPEGIRLLLPDPYYRFCDYNLGNIEANVYNPISFISTSENKTIIEYLETKSGRFVFAFITSDVQTVKFKGIIFQAYKGNTSNMLEVRVKNDAYHFIVEDCVFRNTKANLVFISFEDIKCYLNNPNFYQIEIIKCNFEYVFLISFIICIYIILTFKKEKYIYIQYTLFYYIYNLNILT